MPIRPWHGVFAVVVLALFVVVLRKNPSGYPEQWPGPASSLLSRKGSCPDLSGRYDHVRSELPWLFGRDPNFEGTRAGWAEHVATITQADDGSWLKIRFSLNENGLRAFRRGGATGGRAGAFDDLDLREGEDLDCRGGWYVNRWFPQPEKISGWQRKTLRIARDREGGLIAGATIDQDNSFSWADSRSIPLGSSDVTRWYRWVERDPAADAALHAAEAIEIHRFPWTNGPDRVPLRIDNFFLEPMCLRVVETWPVASIGEVVSLPPQLRRGRDAPAPSFTCPTGWGQFEPLDQMLVQGAIPGDGSPSYRVEWRRLSETGARPVVVSIPDVRALPVMPKGR
jgi:hypothetical protein